MCGGLSSLRRDVLALLDRELADYVLADEHGGSDNGVVTPRKPDDDASIVEVNPLSFVFAGDALEARFASAELLPLWVERLALVGPGLLVSWGVRAVFVISWTTRAPADLSSVLAAAIEVGLCASALALVAIGRRARALSPIALERLTVSMLGAQFVLVLYAVQPAQLVRHANLLLGYAITTEWGKACGLAAANGPAAFGMAARAVVAPVVASLLMPLTPRCGISLILFFLAVASLFALDSSFAALQVLRPPTGDGSKTRGYGALQIVGDLVSDVTTLGVLAMVLAYGFVRRSLAHRHQFALRERLRAARDTHAAYQERTEAKLAKSAAAHAAELRSASAAAQARSQLIRMVMHDLRSPLLSVSNISQTLSSLSPLHKIGVAPVPAVVHALSTCSMLMEDIVSDMLDFERMDSGQLTLAASPFALQQLLDTARDTFLGVASAKGVALLAPSLERGLADALYLGDVRRLQQCLNNGISNALKFTQRGGQVELLVSERFADAPFAESERSEWSSLSFCVKDSGCGLSAKDLELLRRGEAFLQVGQGMSQGNRGTGLGLSLVRHLLFLHDDSKLCLHSDGPKKGTVFEMRLNLRRAPAGALVEADELPTSPYGLGRLSTSAGVDGTDMHTSDEGATPASHATASLATLSPKPLARAADGDGSLSAPRNSVDLGRGHAQTAPLRAMAEAVELMPAPGWISGSRSSGSAGSPSSLSRGRRATTGSSAVADANAVRLRASASAATDLSALAPPLRCLFVDDDPFLQLTMPARIVADCPGIEIESADDGSVAVRLLIDEGRAREFDVVVIDNFMPHMCGTETVRKLREGRFDGLIIGMTGDPSGCPDRLEFESAGLDLCVDKDTPGLLAICERLRSLDVRRQLDWHARTDAGPGDERAWAGGKEACKSGADAEQQPAPPSAARHTSEQAAEAPACRRAATAPEGPADSDFAR